MNAREIRPDKNVVPHREAHNIFLAGTIEMGNSEDWQAKAVEYYEGFNVNIYNPRRKNFDASLIQDMTERKFTEQVTWEQRNLLRSDMVLVNLIPNTLSPISLHELGQQCLIEKKTVVVCCPREFWRRGNVQVSCVLYKMFLYETLEEALSHFRIMLEFATA